MPAGSSFADNTIAYEAWLGALMQLDHDELRDKHRKMRKDPFDFFRATFYRWAPLWGEHAADMRLHDAPEVLGVGDLHVENFGTWRGFDGRLVWGVNDFDEACVLPYVNDLVRLSVSAAIALETGKDEGAFRETVTAEDAAAAILLGYTEGLNDAVAQPDARRPYVLAEQRQWLRRIAAERLEKKDEDGKTAFDKIVDNLSREGLVPLGSPIPEAAAELLLGSFPVPCPYRIGRRQDAGLGSRGRPRYTAVVDDWNGGLIAREVKALAPSAWLWAQGWQKPAAILYAEALNRAVRSPDPWVRIRDGWVVRRLAADTGKIRLRDLPPDLDTKLLRAMGRETANVHSQNVVPLQDVAKDLAVRRAADPTWLYRATQHMKAVTMQDWEACKEAKL